MEENIIDYLERKMKEYLEVQELPKEVKGIIALVGRKLDNISIRLYDIDKRIRGLEKVDK